MSAAISSHALDDGWCLDEPLVPAPAPAPALTIVADAPDEFPDMVVGSIVDTAPSTSLDDGWCLDEPGVAPVPAPALVIVADAFDEYPAIAPEHAEDGWFVEADDREPAMELTSEEAAFFASGEQLATAAPAPVESFDDLAGGPALSFWRRLIRRR
jgi:hypothetical protein